MNQELDTNYRCYHFNNYYLSGIQAGIQAAHAQHRLACKYLQSAIYFEKSKVDKNGTEESTYLEWLENHETIILLNAGMAKDLEDLVAFFDLPENPFPWAEWHESKEALNGCITSIAMVLPSRIYENSGVVGPAMKDAPNPGSCYPTRRTGVEVVKRVDENINYTGHYDLSIRHSGKILETFSEFEIDLMKRMCNLRLMG